MKQFLVLFLGPFDLSYCRIEPFGPPSFTLLGRLARKQ